MRKKVYKQLGWLVMAVAFIALLSGSAWGACKATFTATVDENNSLTVTFDAAGSEGTTYTWYYGDGSTGDGEIASHTYEHSRTYAVTLKVEGDDGCKAMKINNVAVKSAFQTGDVDGNNKIDVFDALIIAEYNVGLKKKEELKGYTAADTNGDGTVNVFDALLLAQFDVKIVLTINRNTDEDGDGYTVNQNDYDDNDPTIYPGAPETCGDGIDQDCDGQDLLCTTEGTFFCGLIEGLEYQTETQSGVTDENGKFQYIEGETIQFSVGGILLGELTAKEVIKPVDLVEEADETNPTLINMVRLLLTLDDDDNANNGILITEAVKNYAKNKGLTLNFALSVADFENEVQETVQTWTALRSTGKRLLVLSNRAQELIQVCVNNEDDYLTDADEDGYAKIQDCNDEAPNVHPDATEICGDEIDQDCDGNDLICPSAEVVTLENGFEITFLEVVYNDDTTSTWRYAVKETETSQNLSNWVLELPDCVTITDATSGYEEVNPDPNANLNGIKWGVTEGFETGEFIITVEGHLSIGKVQVAAKGPEVALGEITGPACEDIPEDNDEDGFTIADGDCDDSQPGINPGAIEICGDEIDQDCDGKDEACEIEPEEGDWTGTTSQEYSIKFTVSNGSVSAIFVKIDYDDQTGECVGNNTLMTGATQVQIVDNVFTYSTAHVEVIGEFTDAKTCTGTFSYVNSSCGGTGSVIWEAELDEEVSDQDIDDDEDGFTENDGDCNDDDAAINPDAEEVCGDGIDQNCDEIDTLCPDDDTEVKEGVFVFAGVVVGLSYKTDTLCGVTDENGTFMYLEGEIVTFFIGDIELGQVEGQDVVTPVDLVEDAEDQTNETVINICSFLMTLDNDSNANNGICIKQEVRLCAIGISLSVDFTLGVSEFETSSVTDLVYMLCSKSLVLAIKAEFYINLTIDETLPEYADDDEDGYTEEDGDCDDTNPNINPGVDEVCDDEEIDYNCDGIAICSDPDVDDDGDGFMENDEDETLRDCNDTDATIYPGAEEECGDGIDQDCDGNDLVCILDTITQGDWEGTTDQEQVITFTVLNNQVTAITVKMNYEGGFNESCVGVNKLMTGEAVKVDIVENSFTFSTSNLDISGTFTSATECSGTWYYKNEICGGTGEGTWQASISGDNADGDSDGFTVELGDCDDTNPDAHPGAGEICGDGIDQDCDGNDLVCIDDSENSDNAGIFSLSLNCSYADTSKYQGVYITIKDIQIKGKGGWQTIASSLNKTYALFDLTNETTAQLVLEKLQAGLEGSYKEIRLILSSTPEGDHPYANYVIDADGEAHELKIASGYTTGIKIKYKFKVVKNESIELILIFNASKSIKVDKKGKKWELKPSLKVKCLCDDDDDSDSKDDDSKDNDSKDNDSKDNNSKDDDEDED